MKSFTILLLCGISATLSLSCNKFQVERCMSNCKDFLITGRVVNGSYNKGVPNLSLHASLVPNALCFICETIVGTVNTDADGNFKLVARFDSTKLSDHTLKVFLKYPDEYIGEDIYKEGSQSYEGFTNDPLEYQGIQFRLYTKASLTIRPKRTLTDNFFFFQMAYRYGDLSNPFFSQSGTTPTTVLERTVITAANVYTKIKSVKTVTFGQEIEKIDSIQCLSGVNNVIDVNY